MWRYLKTILHPSTSGRDTVTSGYEEIFRNIYTERTWTMVTISEAIKDLRKTYVKDPPRKLKSMSHTGPITLSGYPEFQYIRETLGKEASVFSCLRVTSRENTPTKFDETIEAAVR
jgi:hypothetical protein